MFFQTRWEAFRDRRAKARWRMDRMAGVGWVCGRAAVCTHVSQRAYTSGVARAAIRHHRAGVRLTMTHADLEDALSRPSERDIEFARRLEGDIMILGAGGKMGPSRAPWGRRGPGARGGHARSRARAQ